MLLGNRRLGPVLVGDRVREPPGEVVVISSAVSFSMIGFGAVPSIPATMSMHQAHQPSGPRIRQRGEIDTDLGCRGRPVVRQLTG